MNKKYINQLYKNLDDLINNGRLDDKFIILFGANKPAEITVSYLENKNIKVDAIIDNSSKKQGKTLRNVMVYAPDDLLNNIEKDFIILIASLYYKQMRSSIAKHNIDDSKITETLYFAEFSTEQSYFDKNVGVALNGWNVYEKIKQTYGADCFIILIPCPSLGDAYFILSYIDEYIKQNNLRNYVVVMSGGGSVKIAEMFNAPNCAGVAQDENDALLAFYTLMDLPDMLVVSHNFPHTRLSSGNLGDEMLNWGEMIRNVIMGFKNEIPKKELVKSPDMSDKNFFEKNNLIKGKTALIAPAAIHALSLPDSFWSDLTAALIKKGYTVRANVSKDESINITGANPIFIPLDEIIPFVETAGLFISLRNGLCDVLAEAKATKIAIYPDEDYYDFFSIEKIGLTDSFTEVIYDEEKNVLEQIMVRLK